MHDTDGEIAHLTTEACVSDQITTRRPHRRGVAAGPEAYALHATATRVHHVKLLVPAAIRVEHDLATIWAVARTDVDRTGIGQPPRSVAAEIDCHDVRPPT